MQTTASVQYLEPTRAGRIGMTLVLLTGLVALATLAHFSRIQLAQLSALDTLCAELAGYRRWMQLLALVLPVPGLWLALYGRRILRSGQSPPPGAWVLHRVMIKRGAHVTRVGRLLIGLGLLTSLAPLYFWTAPSRQDQENLRQFCDSP